MSREPRSNEEASNGHKIFIPSLSLDGVLSVLSVVGAVLLIVFYVGMREQWRAGVDEKLRNQSTDILNVQQSTAELDKRTTVLESVRVARSGSPRSQGNPPGKEMEQP